jgi:hypothetical protein
VGTIGPVAVMAHAGGWDEILIPVAILAFLGYWLLRKRPEDEPEGEAGRARRGPTTCAYCDAGVPAGEGRCPTCGFRVRVAKA